MSVTALVLCTFLSTQILMTIVVIALDTVCPYPDMPYPEKTSLSVMIYLVYPSDEFGP